MKKALRVLLILILTAVLITIVEVVEAQEIYRDQYVSITLFQAPGANILICIENMTNYDIYTHFKINSQLVNAGLRFPGVVYVIRPYCLIVNKTVEFIYWKYNYPNGTGSQQYEYLGQCSMFMSPLISNEYE